MARATCEQMRASWIKEGLAHIDTRDGAFVWEKSNYRPASDWYFLGFLAWEGWEKFEKVCKDAAQDWRKVLDRNCIDSDTGIAYEVE